MPWQHGAHMPPLGEEISNGFPPMRSDVPTLATRFTDAGYRTVSLSANCLLSPELSLVRGFETAECLDVPGQVESRAEAVLSDGDARPLFLFVNLMPAHAPYDINHARWSSPHADELEPDRAAEWLVPYLKTEPPGVDLGRLDGKHTGIQHFLRGDLAVDDSGWALVRDLYEGEVLEADMKLNRVLKAWGASRSGVVAVTSDHGEAFGEHGKIEHRANVYPQVLAVPLVLAGPGVPVGAVIDEPVPLLALHDTLLTLTGQDAETPGLAPALDGQPWDEPIVVVSWPDPYRAAKVGGDERNTLTLVRAGGDALVLRDQGSPELYAGNDWSTDWAMERPDRAMELAPLGQVVVRDVESSRVDDATRNQLKQLGYIE